MPSWRIMRTGALMWDHKHISKFCKELRRSRALKLDLSTSEVPRTSLTEQFRKRSHDAWIAVASRPLLWMKFFPVKNFRRKQSDPLTTLVSSWGWSWASMQNPWNVWAAKSRSSSKKQPIKSPKSSGYSHKRGTISLSQKTTEPPISAPIDWETGTRTASQAPTASIKWLPKASDSHL